MCDNFELNIKIKHLLRFEVLRCSKFSRISYIKYLTLRKSGCKNAIIVKVSLLKGEKLSAKLDYLLTIYQGFQLVEGGNFFQNAMFFNLIVLKFFYGKISQIAQ